MSPALNALNSAPRKAAIAMMSPMVELSDWVSEAAVDLRPFTTHLALAEALVETILKASPARRTEMFQIHPELAGAEAIEGIMTPASQGEQGRLGLLNLVHDDMTRLSRLNADYQKRFGHPFIIALHRVADLDVLFETFERRLSATEVEEHMTTLAEIASVICARTAKAFGPDAMPAALLPLSSNKPMEQLP